MDALIPVMNKLQDVFGALGSSELSLPQIVCVGSQSSGKSSVIENIVGRDFLPRGTGIVTRRPLVLQLYHTQQNGEEWGEFLHLPGQRFLDFAEIRREIERETDRVVGRNKGVSNASINLKIFSPHVLNLTLVDLPGITKVPTGDQPEDVEELIRDMCLTFITNPNAIILAVTAANQDLANSDGLKLARSVDPEGERTIGVLTKVDIMDAGTDCTDILANRVIPLKKGYIAVINRSQKDIQENLPIRQGLTKEMTYFQTHPKYKTTLSKCGTINLSRTLNQILMHHIRDCLPDIKSKITKHMLEVKANLEALGDANETDNQHGSTLLRIISKFSNGVNSSIDGHVATVDGSIDMTELHGGARISFIFMHIFKSMLSNIDPFDGLSDEDIRVAIANASGTRPSLFLPEYSFELLVRKQITRLEAPGLQCVDMIYDELLHLTHQCETTELTRFPLLHDRFVDVVADMLRNRLKPTQKMISDLIAVELAYINTSHPDFIGGKQALAQNPKNDHHHHQQQQQQHGEAALVNQSSLSGTATQTGVPPMMLDNNNNNNNNTLLPPNPPPPTPPQQYGTPINSSQKHNNSNNNNIPANNNNNNNNNNNEQNYGFFGLFRPQTPVNGNQIPDNNNNNNNNNNALATRHNNNLNNINTTRGSYNNNNNKPGGSTLQERRQSNSHRNQANNNDSSSSSASNNNNNNNNNNVWDSFVKLPQVPDHMKFTTVFDEKEKRDVSIIKTLIRSYFGIVRKSFVDLVPKAVMHFLVNHFRENLQNELVKQLYKEDVMRLLMRESEEVAAQRRGCVEMRDLLQRALDIVNEVRDFKPNNGNNNNNNNK